MKKTLSLIVASIMAIGLLAACGEKGTPADGSTADQSGQTAASGEAFKIGGTGPLTGDAAIYGNAVKNGAELALAEINALGGVQFELNYQDDENDAEKAVNAYNSLKDWGQQIFLSSVTSTPATATSTEAAADHIFGLTPSASAATVTEGNDNIFQMCYTDPNQGVASAQYIADNKLGTKIAIIYKNDEVYSKGIYETFKAKASELGLEIVSETTFTEDSQTDFSVQLADAQSKEADLLYLPMYYTPASLILRQADSMGYEPLFFGVDGMDGILTMEGFDTALAEGVMLLTPFGAGATDKLSVDFVKNYQEKYGEVPNQFAADGYDCMYAILKAIESSNGEITPGMSASDTCDKLVAIFNGGFTFDGLTGAAMTWNEDGQVSKEPRAFVIEDGVYVEN